MKTNKLLSLIVLSSVWSTAVLAESVGRNVALQTAQSYLASKGKMVDTAQKPFKARQQAPGKTDANDDAYYYVFNAGGDNGYVIVSGDDRTEPILGYVEQGSFDAENIPENMRSWLQLYADQIKYIVDNDIQPTSPRLKAKGMVSYTKHSVPELLKSRWNQGHPYNLTCPKYYKEDGTQDYPASGCTATAMAQVVNFYKFPERTKALIPSTSNTYTLANGTKKTVTTKNINRNTKIDWENMRDTYNCDGNHVHNAQDSAVANLLLICGQAVHMHWGPSSGANFDRNTFVNYLGFDDGCYIGERRNYGIDEWFDMLYKDISEGYPVLFSGFSSGGGHAFVLDGFDGENLFHVNWGWGGGSNGWFLVGILNPGDTSGIGASSSSDGYSMSQRALFNLRLPDNVKAEPTDRCTINGITVNGTTIAGNWINWTGSDATFHAGIVKLNDDGTYSLVGNPSVATLGNNNSQQKTFNVRGKLTEEGTYKLSPASKLSTAKVWRPQYNMRTEYIEATVDAEGNIKLTRKDPEFKIEIDTIVFPGTRIAGTEQEVKVTFRNCGDEYFREIHLLASKTSDKVYTENRSMVAVRKGETVDVSYFFTPTEVGTYHLWFSTDNSGRDVVGEGEIEVIDEASATKANLSVNSITITNAVNNTVYGNRLAGKVSIKNVAKTDFDGKIRLQIWRQKKGENVAWSSTSQTVELSVAAGKSATVNFEFTDLSTDYNYHLPVYYVGQSGELANGGLWKYNFVMSPGVLQWTKAGVIQGKASSISFGTLSSICGLYVECDKMNRLTPNKNPNTIYAFAAGMEIPSNLQNSTANWVSGNTAEYIRLENDNPYYVPSAFEADTASFTYNFPETEDGKRWHTFTMPFEADEIYMDGKPITLDDKNNRFWIYEFSKQDADGNIVFTPAKILRAATPYIIAGGPSMAGKSITFRSIGVPFYPTGSDKMVVTTRQYKFHGSTLCPSVKECYVLNSAGTAFEYVTKATALEGLNTYFTTTLDESERLESIILPDVPEEPKAIGDVNGDGAITIQDAVSVLEAMASDTYLPAADVNGDGVITIQDVVGLLEIMAQN